MGTASSLLVDIILPCRSCKKSWLDITQPQLMPLGMRALIPVELTAYSGLGTAPSLLLRTQPAQGVSFTSLAGMYNEMLRQAHAERHHMYLSMLADSMCASDQVGVVNG